MDQSNSRWEAWVQWIGIVVLLTGGIIHFDERLSHVEQAQADSAVRQAEITAHLDRIEERIDRYIEGHQVAAR